MGKDKSVWAELQRQLDARGLKVKRGTIQDATFTETDPGSSKKLRDEVLRLAAAEVEPGQRTGKKLISAISCIRRLISIST